MKIPKEEKIEPGFGTVNFERRKHPRFSVNCPLVYRPLEDSNSNSAHANDIGEGGLMLFLPDELEIGQILTIKLFIGDLLQLEPIEAIVQVVWKGLLYENGTYPVGVKFVEITPEDFIKLKTFLKNLENLEKPRDLRFPSRLLSILGIQSHRPPAKPDA